MNSKLNQLKNLVKNDLGLFLSISFGVFLFILFFQPLPVDRFDFNNRLIFVAGFGAIVFLFMLLVRIIYPWIIQNKDQNKDEIFVVPNPNMGAFSIFVLSSIAFGFYLHYVGLASISIYTMFKGVLICLAPPVILRLYDSYRELKQQNESLLKERKKIQQQVEKYEEDYQNKSIEFISENTAERLTLPIAEVAFIKSADNYVEIVYKEGDDFKKKLIRNTLKNIEQLIKPYSIFIRCHRICIVNTLYIDKLNRNINNHWLTIKGFDEHIPVSRQYILKIKENL
jgi:hypothetical protein